MNTLPLPEKRATPPLPKHQGEWEVTSCRRGARINYDLLGICHRYHVWLRKSDGSTMKISYQHGHGSEEAARYHALDQANTYSP